MKRALLLLVAIALPTIASAQTIVTQGPQTIDARSWPMHVVFGGTAIDPRAIRTLTVSDQVTAILGASGQVIGHVVVDTAPTTAVTQSGTWSVRMQDGAGTTISSTANGLWGVIRDAAGNARGANVNASNQLSVSVDNTPHVVVDSAPTTAVTCATCATATNQTGGGQKTQLVDGGGNVAGETANALDINIKSGSIANTGFNVNNAPSITNITGSVSLPTGASTESTLALIKAKTDNIDVALSTRTKPADQQHVLVDTAPTTAVTIADGADATLGAKADAKSAATDTTAITAMQVLKEISAMEQAPASRAVTNAGTFATQATLQAGSAIAGKFGIDQTTPGTTNGVQVNAALPAGTNVIGHVIDDSGSTTAVTGNVATTAADGSSVTLGAKADAKSTATDTTAVSVVQVLKEISAMEQAPASRAVTNAGTFAVQAAATIADGSDATVGAKADAKSTATDTTAVSVMQVLKEISAMEQAPASQAVTNTGTFATQATLQAGAAIAGKFGIDQTTPGTTNGVQVNAALPAGTNVIGHVIGDSGSTTAVTGNVATTAADGSSVTLGAKGDAKSTATDTTAITVMQVLKEISAMEQAPAARAVTNAGTFAVQAASTIADGADATVGAKADAKSTATDTTAVTIMQVLKEISAMEQAPASRAVTNTGTFAVQAAATIADAADATLGAKADAKSTATDTTAVTIMQVLKEISAMEQAPASRAVTNTGTFATQATLQAGAAIAGKFGIDQTTPGTTNGVQVNAALPAGTNVIGHVISDSGSTTAVTGNVTAVQATAASLNMTEASAAAIKADVDKIPSLGQALAAASAPVVLPATQITALTPPAAIVGFALEAGHTATIDTSTAASKTDLDMLVTSNAPLNVPGGGAYVRQDSTNSIAKETGGNLATTATNTRVRGATATPVMVMATDQDTQLLALNTSRVSWQVCNQSRSPMRVKFGSGASRFSFNVLVSAGQCYADQSYTGQVDAVWDVGADQFASVSESQ